jgi:DNA-binding PadR family transcriptional regulator
MVAAPEAPRKPRQNRTRWVVLGMLTTGPMSGYGLRQRIAGSVGHFWQESYGQLYPTLRQLAAEGLVEARPARGGPGRGGAVYHLTPRGREALAAWVALPPVLEPERNEVLLKVFFAGAVPPEVTARNLAGVAAALAGQRAQLEAIAARLDAAPVRHPDEPYWRLTLDFGLAFMRTALEWLERAQRVLRARPARPRAKAPARPSTAARARAPRRPEAR